MLRIVYTVTWTTEAGQTAEHIAKTGREAIKVAEAAMTLGKDVRIELRRKQY